MDPAIPAASGDRRCRAKSKRSQEQCKRYAIAGGNVCLIHGGNSPGAKAKAAERLRTREIEKAAAAVLAHEGLTPVEDPLTELGRLAQSSMKLSEALGARVNALRELEHFDAKDSPTIKAEVQMYERAMDRTHRLLDSLVKHGYTERQTRIAEAEAALVTGVIRRVLQGIGLTAEQITDASRLLAHEFAALDAASDLI